jgi:hypothetical protein
MIPFETEREKWIWLACAIDTECSLGLYKRGQGPRVSVRRGFSWSPVLRCASTTPVLLEQIKLICKGGAINNQPFQTVARKTQKQYRLSSNGLRYILPNVIPFLLVKRRNAELLLEALNIMGKIGFRAKRNQYTKIDEKRLEEIYQELRRLNQRGVKILSK